MNICKKYFLLFLTCLFLASGAQAQGRFIGLRGKFTHLNRSHVSASNTSLLLQNRLKVSFAKAQQIQQVRPLEAELVASRPYTTLSKQIQQPQLLYPNMASFLTTPQQWTDYFLSNQNRRIQTETLRMERKLNDLTTHLFNLYSMRHRVLAEQDQYMRLLAQQIPADTQYLLLGESHHMLIRRYIADFLIQFRQQYPDKEIILLTEFLKEGPREESDWQFSEKHLAAVFNNARQLQIPVIGLEPPFVFENEKILLTGNNGYLAQHIWESLEGMALRNRRWIETIRQQRQEHPQALFIIYAGGGHLSYHQPYSLTNELPEQGVFHALLLPYSMTRNEDGLSYISPYDHLIIEQDISPSRFIYFDKPQARAAGFDTRILLEDK